LSSSPGTNPTESCQDSVGCHCGLVKTSRVNSETRIKTAGEAHGSFLVELMQPLEQRVIDANSLLPHRRLWAG
jgi:hypothetical protein